MRATLCGPGFAGQAQADGRGNDEFGTQLQKTAPRNTALLQVCRNRLSLLSVVMDSLPGNLAIRQFVGRPQE
jgi:hypothetical protein